MKNWLDNMGDKLKNNQLASKLVVGLGLLGMALIVCAELFGAGDEGNASTTAATQSILETEGQGVTTATISTEETYRQNLEESLAALIAQLDGAGQAVVMVTLVSGEETVYAYNTTETETQSSQSHVLLDDGTALSETVLTPAVCGVVVLCEGGDSVVVEAKIVAMLTALFDISSNHISVEKLA